MAELKMGDEIYVYLKGGKKYTSLESKNGYEDQVFDSSKYPTKVRAAYLWDEQGEDGNWYEVYVFMEIPEALRHFLLMGRLGIKNAESELNRIVSNTIAGYTVEDGREILNVKSIDAKIVNKIAGVKVDIKHGILYPENNPNIKQKTNYHSIVGYSGFSKEVKFFEEQKILNEFITKDGRVEETSYQYLFDDDELDIPAYKKSILDIGIPYYLASRSVRIKESIGTVHIIKDIDYTGLIPENRYSASFSVRVVEDGGVRAYDLCYSQGGIHAYFSGVRPVFRLQRKEKIGENKKEKVDSDVQKNMDKAQELEEICKNLKKNLEDVKQMKENLEKSIDYLDNILKDSYNN